MRVVIFGASGMIGSAALLECLESPDVTEVVTVGRSSSGRSHDKLREILHADFLDLSPIESELGGLDACFWCLGVSSAGMSEADYAVVTYDYTKACAEALLRLNPDMVMCFVSGLGTDSTEAKGPMWARVKGRAENLLLAMGFRRAVMFRPGFIQPERGVRSRMRLYAALYSATRPLFPALKRLFPRSVTTSTAVGRAMIVAAQDGAPKAILDSDDISVLGGGS